jgi:hypothetical protein
MRSCRSPDAPTPAGRGASPLEYKRFDDAEFEIIGAVSARGRDAGCVICQCATETGQTFDVVPAWPDYERRAALANAGSFIGCMLTVYFCGRTRSGEPRCATGIAMRIAEAGAMTEADVQWRTYGADGGCHPDG